MTKISLEEIENNKKIWLSLPDKHKKIRLERIYRMLRNVSDKQLSILDEFKKSKSVVKTARHLYFFIIVTSFWEDGDFALSLGRNKFKHYAVYPARTMMEKLLKIIWFTKLKTAKDQDLITKKELLKSCLISYKRELSDGRATTGFEDYYKKINDVGLPEISKVKIKELKAFPEYKEMCKKSGLLDSNNFYNSYRDLSGLPHGNLLSVFIIQNNQTEQEYIRAMLNIIRFCIEMLKITDYHIEHKTKKEVEEIIQKSRIVSFN